MALHSGTQRLLAVLLSIYLVLLTWIVIWKLEVPFVGLRESRPIKWIPFLASGGYAASGQLEMAVNFLLFVPFGIYLGLLAPAWSWWRKAGAMLAVSLLFEVTQHVLAVGSADATDLVVNSAGGIAGMVLVVLVRRGLRARTTVVLTPLCLIATAFGLFFCVTFFLSPVHYR